MGATDHEEGEQLPPPPSGFLESGIDRLEVNVERKQKDGSK